jgi:hypothetical protein
MLSILTPPLYVHCCCHLAHVVKTTQLEQSHSAYELGYRRAVILSNEVRESDRMLRGWGGVKEDAAQHESKRYTKSELIETTASRLKRILTI